MKTIDPTKRNHHLPVVVQLQDAIAIQTQIYKLRDMANQLIEKYDRPLDALPIVDEQLRLERRLERIFSLFEATRLPDDEIVKQGEAIFEESKNVTK